MPRGIITDSSLEKDILMVKIRIWANELHVYYGVFVYLLSLCLMLAQWKTGTALHTKGKESAHTCMHEYARAHSP